MSHKKIKLILSKVKKSYLTKYGFIAIGDSRKHVNYLPGDYFDVVITSPPYYNLKDYKHTNQIGNGQLYEDYLKDIISIFNKCYYVCKDTGSLWLVVDTFSMKQKTVLLPFELAKKLEPIGWHLHEIIIWQKDRTIPWTTGARFRKSYEYVLFFTKSDKFKFYGEKLRDTFDLKKWWVRYPERYHPKGKMPTDVWYIPLQYQGAWGGNKFPKHLCPFPFELVERILTLVTDKGDNVFDPFAGTGAVLAQAEAMQRNYVGFELNKTFLKEFKEKTLPAAINRKKQMSKQSDIKEFSSLIILLRAVKYCSILIKEYRKLKINKHGGSDLPKCGMIFVNKKDLSKPKIPLSIDLTLFWDKKINKSDREEIKTITERDPLSFFGVIPNISHVATITGLENFVSSHKVKKLYRYNVGNTHKFKEVFDLKTLKNYFQKNDESTVKSLPIFSNVALYVEEE